GGLYARASCGRCSAAGTGMGTGGSPMVVMALSPAPTSTASGTATVSTVVEAGGLEDGRQTRDDHVDVGQEPGAVGETYQLCEVEDRAGALLAAHHPEVGLVPVEISQEGQPGLVVIGRRLEDVT